MISFILNDKDISSDQPPDLPVLDFLRHYQRLTGTKEACREGDCGACTVLVGQLCRDRVKYMTVTSCLLPLGELQGKHLVSIEGLNMDRLTPVQQAIVGQGATQCGFCSPGIVVSLTGFLMVDSAEINEPDIKKALGGHLCRCTGYRSLKQCWHNLQKAVGHQTGLEALLDNEMLPAYFREIPARLRSIPKPEPVSIESETSVVIAGGTDIYVQKGEKLLGFRLKMLNLDPGLKGISRQNGYIRLGALTTFEEFANQSQILEIIPNIRAFMSLVGSRQIRNRATLGGNIVNASPIGDMAILLLALDSVLVLEDGENRRTVPMTAFYKDYKQLDKTPSEILTEIRVPIPSSTTVIDFEKVAKRKYFDIASVNSAIRIDCEQGLIRQIGLSVGGVAPIPLFLTQTCQFLIGKEVTVETVKAALPVAQGELSPISDVRGSAEYKRLLVRQLMIAHFSKLFPDTLSIRRLLN